ncbi:hypothetical protein MPTK1_8g10720 [Marchantia polymorpha subsp. ruderalis]|uniref:Uncharacterized protein n=1 Tax=Marchantia polymorpha TaxID=3197 RepID=A0A2R6XMR1_MARPO|nr:hypothetical protein MARPO_0008s0151 [Marchantia polymorpha]BBN19443.1 hypothetical protein Mp_8g10720 [Marchantia polymorpha subsp. ruderalis]|eukprot:PTQ47389.1 hypothetical protein MARPO_0008s0151 [Marchantia polymorpha]
MFVPTLDATPSIRTRESQNSRAEMFGGMRTFHFLLSRESANTNHHWKQRQVAVVLTTRIMRECTELRVRCIRAFLLLTCESSLERTALLSRRRIDWALNPPNLNPSTSKLMLQYGAPTESVKVNFYRERCSDHGG